MASPFSTACHGYHGSWRESIEQSILQHLTFTTDWRHPRPIGSKLTSAQTSPAATNATSFIKTRWWVSFMKTNGGFLHINMIKYVCTQLVIIMWTDIAIQIWGCLKTRDPKHSLRLLFRYPHPRNVIHGSMQRPGMAQKPCSFQTHINQQTATP